MEAATVSEPALPIVPADVQAIAARIPVFAGISEPVVTPPAGVISLNNRNYRVEAGGKAYLLRIGAETAHLLGIRREEEIETARAAASVGVGPEILYAESNGVMVMPFIDGGHWEPEAFHDPANIVRLAETLRRLHAVKTVAARGSEFRRIERLLESAVSLGLEMPPDLDRHLRKLARIEQQRRSDPRYVDGLAHNDFWGNNFLDDGRTLYLIDWEFSGTGDTLIDLATLSYAGDYSEQEQIALLDAYGLKEPGSLAVLQTMRWVVSFFEGAWALVMHGIRGSRPGGDVGRGEFDYRNHARVMFERLSSV